MFCRCMGGIMTKIKLEQICKKLSGNLVLDHIDLELESGCIYGFRGQNGSGKTMLMRCISGLILPNSGKVIINDKVLHQDIQVPESIGALIENPAFLSRYTGYTNLKMLASLAGKIKKEDIILALNRAGLDPDDKRTYKKYSLGMKQKLGLANAIMGEPDIVILDEPINALDEESVEHFKKVLIDLKEKDKLIIVACHDREELDYLSDVIYEIKDGKIVGRG